jgi:hypothetical protein
VAPAVQAWNIETKSVKFIKVDLAGMSFPRTGVDTADGGP